MDNSTNTKKILLSKKKIAQTQIFWCGNFTSFISKSCQIWDNFFLLFFPKDYESLKSLDIRL